MRKFLQQYATQTELTPQVIHTQTCYTTTATEGIDEVNNMQSGEYQWTSVVSKDYSNHPSQPGTHLHNLDMI